MDSPSESQEEETKETMYDEIDMNDNYSRGYWVGCLVGGISAFVLAIGVGLYYIS